MPYKHQQQSLSAVSYDLDSMHGEGASKSIQARAVAMVADAVFDQRLRDPEGIAAAVMEMDRAHRETLRVLLDMLADHGDSSQ